MALETATGALREKTLAVGCAGLLLAACAAHIRPPAEHTPAPVAITPIDVTTTYIATYGHHYAHGQYAVVQVCVQPDGAIASTRIVISSAQKTFDESALGWARQAHYQPQRENGQAVFGCQEVRVEINLRRDNSVGRGADSALG
jgi:TonB family protein